jgi:alanine dehydrogenase
MTVLSYLHFAVASPDLAETLAEKQLNAIAYEMIRREDGSLPVLLPTSQVAGRLAPIIAGRLLENAYGGRGILLSGIPGVPPAAVVIIGAGVLGLNAAQSFRGLGAQVTLLDQEYAKLESADRAFQGNITTLLSSQYNLSRVLKFADVVVGAVLVPGERTPILLSREMIRQMRPLAVFLDFSIDQGGCSETSRPSTHQYPTYVEEGVIHFAVPNVTARVARTASYALTNAALPYLIRIGEWGLEGALAASPALRNGLKVRQGIIQSP